MVSVALLAQGRIIRAEEAVRGKPIWPLDRSLLAVVGLCYMPGHMGGGWPRTAVGHRSILTGLGQALQSVAM